jgi:hypothetical protein
MVFMQIHKQWAQEDTRTTATDVEVTPQDCVDPGEIKVVFCPKPDSAVAGHL